MPEHFLSNKLVYITPAWPTIQPPRSLSLITAVSSDVPDSGGEADLFVLVDVTHIRLMCLFSAPTFSCRKQFHSFTIKREKNYIIVPQLCIQKSGCDYQSVSLMGAPCQVSEMKS